MSPLVFVAWFALSPFLGALLGAGICHVYYRTKWWWIERRWRGEGLRRIEVECHECRHQTISRDGRCVMCGWGPA